MIIEKGFAEYMLSVYRCHLWEMTLEITVTFKFLLCLVIYFDIFITANTLRLELLLKKGKQLLHCYMGERRVGLHWTHRNLLELFFSVISKTSEATMTKHEPWSVLCSFSYVFLFCKISQGPNKKVNFIRLQKLCLWKVFLI